MKIQLIIKWDSILKKEEILHIKIILKKKKINNYLNINYLQNQIVTNTINI